LSQKKKKNQENGNLFSNYGFSEPSQVLVFIECFCVVGDVADLLGL
jgi:hypothetical protein